MLTLTSICILTAVRYMHNNKSQFTEYYHRYSTGIQKIIYELRIIDYQKLNH